MPRLPRLTPDTADDRQRDLLDQTERALGRVPNLYATLATSPAALTGYLALRDALSRGVLRARVREQLALLVAQRNDCGYCVAAHTYRGARVGLTAEELRATRDGHDNDPHTDAILRTASAVIAHRGALPDADLAAARADGVTDPELAEIVAHVALNALSNYFNHLAQPELDFPAVDDAEAAA